MMKSIGLVLLLLGLAIQASSESNVVPGTAWKKFASPEQAGWSSKNLAKIHEYIKDIGSTSVMIVQHGVVVVAWGKLHADRICTLAARAC
jgi:hypothetical protein